jgi:uncharacterized protein (DUF305 family)
MKNRTRKGVPLLLLGAVLGAALSGCGDRGGDRTAGTADTAAPVAADTPPADAAPPPSPEPGAGVPATDGQGQGSAELHRLLVDGFSTRPTMTGDIDEDFAATMTPPLQAAVRMVDVLLRDGKDTALKALAEKIKADRQAQIDRLQPYASGAMHGKPGNEGMPSDQPQAELQRILDEGKAMDTPESGDVDRDFATSMTLLDRSDVRMMDVLLQNGRAAELKAMVGEMKAARQDELGKLEPFTR